MHKRTRLVVCLTVVSVLLAPGGVGAQASRQVTVQYQNAPLSRIAQNFAVFSGRSITLASEIGDPVLTASVQNLDWEAGLDHILSTQSLIARPGAGGDLRIEPERRISIVYQNAQLSRVVSGLAAFAGRPIALAPGAGDPEVTASLHDLDWQRALDQVLVPIGLVARADGAGVLRIESKNTR